MINNPIVYGGGALDPLESPAAASDILAGKEAYGDNGAKITGTMPDPIPAKGFIYEDYDADGFPHTCRFVGTWTSIPDVYLFYAIRTNNITKYITEITIPGTVVSLGSNALGYCTGLSDIVLPEGLKSIGGQALQGCTGLESLTIPASVNELKINSQVADCTNLKEVYYLGQPIIGANTFRGNTATMLYDFSHATSVPSLYSTASLGHKAGCVIKVPQALLADWQTATNWVNLTNVEWQGV